MIFPPHYDFSIIPSDNLNCVTVYHGVLPLYTNYPPNEIAINMKNIALYDRIYCLTLEEIILKIYIFEYRSFRQAQKYG